MMKTLKGFSLLILTFVFMASAFAQVKKEQTKDSTLDPFYQQLELIEFLTPTVERVDLARLLVVRNMIQIIIENIKTNRLSSKKEVTFQTLHLIQGLIVQYRFSKVFFGWTEPRSLISIYTENTAEALQKLETLSKAIGSEYGYDDSPYTQITANTFEQMQKLLKAAEDLSLSPEFKAKLRSLWEPIGKVVAIAKQGDRPEAFKKSMPIVQILREMYPLFNAVSSSNAGFQVVLELQGLNEFYAEFAQMVE